MPALTAAPHEGIVVLDNKQRERPFLLSMKAHERQLLAQLPEECSAFAFPVGECEGISHVHSMDVFKHEIFLADGGAEVAVTEGEKAAMRLNHFLNKYMC